ncbi:hypothetical protein [Algoriphagus sediminis]|uniref:Uncharacterized protein n=1 Tax=Algoriphagus sediminis TaxID=3057113 RepID=A0ABT7YB72_9BACT|nr:hypothetical protein [Algoriphagus sediminis]MDN3203767.1 hypothetical protein [Algoriphagus sediminis]
MKPDFEAIFEDLKTGALELSKLTVKQYKDEAQADVMAFLKDSKESLKRWTSLLAAGELTVADFEWLVESQKDLLLMNGLKQTALSKIRMEHFKTSVLNFVVDTALDHVAKELS